MPSTPDRYVTDEVQAALDQLVGRTLTAARVREVGEGEAWELTLVAEGVEVVLVTQDSDGYESWLRLTGTVPPETGGRSDGS